MLFPLVLLPLVLCSPLRPSPPSPSPSPSPSRSIPVPVVIWHGLGDRYDSPGLLELKHDIESREGMEGVFVWIVRGAEGGGKDQRSTFFSSAPTQVLSVCAQLSSLPSLTSPSLNPSLTFDAIGFSQGGLLLRAMVEMCGPLGDSGVVVRNLITLGSPHMGVDSLPACPPDSSPLSPCHLMHLSLVRNSIFSPFAQSTILPAQYFRSESNIAEYLSKSVFLRFVNNERVGDDEVGPIGEGNRGRLFRIDGEEDGEMPPEWEPRNETYKTHLTQISNLVLFRFSLDTTITPPHSAHFTLPSPSSTACPLPPLPPVPGCYLDPVPFDELPLYAEDYVGLRELDERGSVSWGMCEGAHMQIGRECWGEVMEWLGDGGERGRGR